MMRRSFAPPRSLEPRAGKAAGRFGVPATRQAIALIAGLPYIARISHAGTKL
jgi:hypothetical protein